MILSNVIDVSGMFKCAKQFNQSLHKWDTSNIIYMTDMFKLAIEFNQDLNSWNIHSVKHITNIFYINKLYTTIKFNKVNCKDWDLSNITEQDKYGLFTVLNYN